MKRMGEWEKKKKICPIPKIGLHILRRKMMGDTGKTEYPSADSMLSEKTKVEKYPRCPPTVIDTRPSISEKSRRMEELAKAKSN
jgi:hypothetical protein